MELQLRKIGNGFMAANIATNEALCKFTNIKPWGFIGFSGMRALTLLQDLRRCGYKITYVTDLAV